ncbi:hypothetical protein [Olsenella uli]|uniref:hypothetical protein n=1 Tax=Olsenella uli TaxID=133926 RepID=UPI0012ABFCB2|nr:hypothetical protein [Olsenella uli]
MEEKTRKFNAKRIAVAALLALALVAGGVAAGWLITSRGAAGSGGDQVTDTQSVGGGPDSGQIPPDAKQVPEDQLQGGGEVTFSS